jgi:cytochrome c553
MGFRRPFALTALIAAVAPIAVALAVAPVQDAPAGAATAAPASTAAADAAKAAEATLAKLEAVPTKPGDAAVGKTKAIACGACHGADGNSTDAQYPKLAGQSEQYIAAQLMRFKSGVRQNAIMAGMAATLAPQDMHDIGAYFSEQQRKPGVANPALATAGEKLYREGNPAVGVPACMACHGPDGAGNPGWRVPNIGGQHAQYVEAQLKAWHDGTTWGSGTHAMIMPTIAKKLTADEIAAVSSYVEGLHEAPPAAPEAVGTAPTQPTK